jgi:hypothetical protein
MKRPVPIGAVLSAAILLAGCAGCQPDQHLPDWTTKGTPSKQDLLEFHRQRALALDSLIDRETAEWGSVVRSGTGIRSERLDSIPGSPAVAELTEGTVLELHHRFELLDGTVITDWQTDGPLAFEPGSTDLPSGFHELIGEAHIGDSLRALIPPVRAWGMSGLPPDIPQEAVISVHLRIGLYRRPA